MRDGVALEIDVFGTNTHFAFKVKTPDDMQCHSFRVLADLARRVRPMVDNAIVDRTMEVGPPTELGGLDWFFRYTQRWGTLDQFHRGESVSYVFRTVPQSAVVVMEALREFEQRLLLEADLDEPCIYNWFYSMKRTIC